jgi:hypothetical protein
LYFSTAVTERFELRGVRRVDRRVSVANLALVARVLNVNVGNMNFLGLCIASDESATQSVRSVHRDQHARPGIIQLRIPCMEIRPR